MWFVHVESKIPGGCPSDVREAAEVEDWELEKEVSSLHTYVEIISLKCDVPHTTIS